MRSPLTIAISQNTMILALFAIACTLTVSLVSELTKDRIKVQEQQQLLNTLHSIIEPSRYDNDIANDCVLITSPQLGTDKVNTAYIARKSGNVVAVAITSTAPQGYSGNIDFIMAINNDGSVNGVRVLKHQETPGLGDKIEVRKSDWINSFTGKTLRSEDDNRWAVAKDSGIFDQFTGATITPRAVVSGVKNTLNYFNKNKAMLLTSANDCTSDVNNDVNSDEINRDTVSHNTKTDANFSAVQQKASLPTTAISEAANE
ncbi:electron transport complex subunit RsxG [Colwellia sp. E2M01]|nr:electron transport complex subunit RsxG [Colwellia sp. E2M01]